MYVNDATMLQKIKNDIIVNGKLNISAFNIYIGYTNWINGLLF